MASFNYPFNIVKNTPAIAGQVQTNFNDLLTWVMANLIQRDGTVAMTGPLVLAPGEPASPDHAANKAYVDAVIPIGIVWEYAGTSLPTGWLWADGATYSNTSQPRLAAAIGRAFTDTAVPAGSFQVPDKRKRVSVGADPSEAAAFGLGVKGGQRNTELQVHSHTVPAHGHTASGSSGEADRNHTHAYSGTTSGGGNHQHGQPIVDNAGPNMSSPSGYGPGNIGTFYTGFAGDHSHTFSGTTGGFSSQHAHAVYVTVNNAAAFATQDSGNGTTLTDKNLPPYVAVNYIIYSGT
jgi:hypothetical protein